MVPTLETVSKERPIIFSGPMVRALLEGRKTQTRRVVRSPEKYSNIRECDFCSPYGQAGDRLWVRETFRGKAPWEWEYRAEQDPATDGWKWTPAIHMPRVACRLVLEVTATRIERLQEISDADAQAEGARYFPSIPIGTPFKYGRDDIRWSMEDAPPNTDHCLSTARYAFANFWNKLRGYDATSGEPDSWDGNPWVWVVEFKRA